MKVKIIQLTNATFDEVKPHIGTKSPKDLPELFVDIDNGDLFFPYRQDGSGEVRLKWSTRRDKNKSVRITIIG